MYKFLCKYSLVSRCNNYKCLCKLCYADIFLLFDSFFSFISKTSFGNVWWLLISVESFSCTCWKSHQLNHYLLQSMLIELRYEQDSYSDSIVILLFLRPKIAIDLLLELLFRKTSSISFKLWSPRSLLLFSSWWYNIR